MIKKITNLLLATSVALSLMSVPAFASSETDLAFSTALEKTKQGTYILNMYLTNVTDQPVTGTVYFVFEDKVIGWPETKPAFATIEEEYIGEGDQKGGWYVEGLPGRQGEIFKVEIPASSVKNGVAKLSYTIGKDDPVVNIDNYSNADLLKNMGSNIKSIEAALDYPEKPANVAKENKTPQPVQQPKKEDPKKEQPKNTQSTPSKPDGKDMDKPVANDGQQDPSKEVVKEPSAPVANVDSPSKDNESEGMSTETVESSESAEETTNDTQEPSAPEPTSADDEENVDISKPASDGSKETAKKIELDENENSGPNYLLYGGVGAVALIVIALVTINIRKKK